MRAGRRTARLGLRDRRPGWRLEIVLATGAGGGTVAGVPVGAPLRTGGCSRVTGTRWGTATAARDRARVPRSNRARRPDGTDGQVVAR